MPPPGLPPNFIRFAHHSYSQMVRVLRRTAARCAHVARTYSIGRSFEGRDLLVIELSARPGQHELSKRAWWEGPLPLGKELGLGEPGLEHSGLRGRCVGHLPRCRLIHPQT